jgi:hypothetical protein
VIPIETEIVIPVESRLLNKHEEDEDINEDNDSEELKELQKKNLGYLGYDIRCKHTCTLFKISFHIHIKILKLFENIGIEIFFSYAITFPNYKCRQRILAEFE